MFKILIAGGPCEHFIAKCIDSVLSQTVQNFEVLISLDPYDNAPQITKRFESERVKVWTNPKPRGSLYNVYCATCMSKMEDDDILVFMDADDWLLHDRALECVDRIYKVYPNTLITHGGWTTGNKAYDKTETLLPYTEKDFEDIRNARWKATQLKTMKWVVYKNISLDEFKDETGQWFFRGGDHALMFPALEMAGYDRVKCVTEKIYFYNRFDRSVTPEGKICPEKDVAYICSKKPYQRLEI